MTQKGGSFRVDRDTKKFWQERKRQMLAGNRSRLGPSGWNSSHRVTIALIAIETVGWILESFFPAWFYIYLSLWAVSPSSCWRPSCPEVS